MALDMHPAFPSGHRLLLSQPRTPARPLVARAAAPGELSCRDSGRSEASKDGHSLESLQLLDGAVEEVRGSGTAGKEGGDYAESLGVRAALAALLFYKAAISPLLPKSCRFLPTCSEYSMRAYREYGTARGTALTVWRVLRCNPLSEGGWDPPFWPPPGLAWLFGSGISGP
ncbi:hypothetical protein WJX81_004569 [Elliptochloris bilobata]|uniref:Membrane protein insertion efficiency factor n=1 Tax=Elliptochloris bilobata TaxID=381761 RepID=A0AAW1S8D2_9CHLO